MKLLKVLQPAFNDLGKDITLLERFMIILKLSAGVCLNSLESNSDTKKFFSKIMKLEFTTDVVKFKEEIKTCVNKILKFEFEIVASLNRFKCQISCLTGLNSRDYLHTIELNNLAKIRPPRKWCVPTQIFDFPVSSILLTHLQVFIANWGSVPVRINYKQPFKIFREPLPHKKGKHGSGSNIVIELTNSILSTLGPYSVEEGQNSSPHLEK